LLKHIKNQGYYVNAKGKSKGGKWESTAPSWTRPYGDERNQFSRQKDNDGIGRERDGAARRHGHVKEEGRSRSPSAERQRIEVPRDRFGCSIFLG